MGFREGLGEGGGFLVGLMINKPCMACLGPGFQAVLRFLVWVFVAWVCRVIRVKAEALMVYKTPSKRSGV